MRLEPDDAVRHVDTRVLELPGPVDVPRLVEAGPELDEHRDLLSTLGRLDERRDERAVAGGAIQGLLDAEHAGVGRRLLDEPLDRRVERLVGHVDEDVPAAGGREDVGLVVPLQAPRDLRAPDRETQVRLVDVRDAVQDAVVEDGVGLVHVVLVEVELVEDEPQHPFIRLPTDLEADGAGEATFPELLLDVLEQVLGVLAVLLDVGVPRDPERHDPEDLHAREEVVEVVLDDLLHRYEAPSVAQVVEAGRDLRHLDAGEQFLGLPHSSHQDADGDAEVGDEGEAVARIDRERRQDRKDVRPVPRLGVAALVGREFLPRQELDPLFGQSWSDIVAEAPLLQVHQLEDHSAQLEQLLLRWKRLPGLAPQPHRLATLEAADPLHEELVEVACRDRQEPDPLEKRVPGIDRLEEDPTIELQPLDVAVEEPCGVLEADRAGIDEIGVGATDGGAGGGFGHEGRFEGGGRCVARESPILTDRRPSGIRNRGIHPQDRLESTGRCSLAPPRPRRRRVADRPVRLPG